MQIKVSNNSVNKSGLTILRMLKASGFKAYFVGGSVRDLILKRELNNIDISTDAVPDEVEKLLAKSGYIHKQVGKKFGTILAIINKTPLEITTFRAEGRYSDRRHPDQVKFIMEPSVDALRRDFTINAMYFDPASGEFLDPANGMSDLKSKLIRFVGKSTDRIDEDSLRMLRAVRFATQLEYKIEKNSFAAIKTRAKYIQKVSGERIKNELDKILASDNRVAGLRLLDQAGLLSFLIPEFVQSKKVFHKSKRYHLEGSTFEHTLNVVSYLKELPLVYAGIFHDLGKVNVGKKELNNGEWVIRYRGHQAESVAIFQNFARRLKFPAFDYKLVSWLILHHDDRVSFRESKLKNQIKYIRQPHLPLLLELWKADSLGNIRLLDNGKIGSRTSPAYILAKNILNKLKRNESLIKKLTAGESIMKFAKIKPGPQVKALQNKIIEKIFLGNIKNESDLKNFLINSRFIS